MQKRRPLLAVAVCTVIATSVVLWREHSGADPQGLPADAVAGTRDRPVPPAAVGGDVAADGTPIRTDAPADALADLLVRVSCDGLPLAGARVTVLPFQADFARSLLAGESPIATLQRARESIADADGRVRIQRDATDPVLVVADLDGYSSNGALAQLGSDAVAIELERGNAVRCWVVTFKGTPVAEPWLRVGPANRGMARIGIEDPLDPAQLARWLRPPRVSREADGAFLLADLPNGWVGVEAGADGYTTEIWDFICPWRGHTDVLMVLYDDAVVTGRLLAADGSPVADAFVDAYLKEWGVSNWRRPAQTDADGRFRIDHMPAGMEGLGLLARVAGVGSARVQLPRLTPGQVYDHTLMLEPPTLLRGSVIGSNGEAIRGAQVSVTDVASGHPVATEGTAADGSFVCDVGGAGTYFVDVQHRKFAQPEWLEVVVPGEAVTIAMRPNGVVQGTVRLRDVPLSGGQVELILDDSQGRRLERRTTHIDAAGNYRFTEVTGSEFPYELLAYRQGQADAAPTRLTGQIVDPPRTDAEDFDIDLDPHGRAVHGRVTDASSGLPLVGAPVCLVDVQRSGWSRARLPLSTTTDDQGRYLFPHVESDWPVGVMLDHPPYARTVSVVPAAPGDPNTTCDIAAKPGSTVRLWLADFDGTAINRFDVYVSGSGRERIESIAHGPFEELAGLEPGPATLGVGVYFHGQAEVMGQLIQRVVDLQPGAVHDVRFTLATCPRIRGRLRGAVTRGRAFSVYLVPKGTLQYVSWRQIDRSNEFLLFADQPGSYDVLVEANDGGPALRAFHTVDLGVGEERTLDFDMPASGVIGSITDEQGRPCVGATLELALAGSDQDLFRGVTKAFGRTDGEGRFEIVGLAPGLYGYAAISDGFGDVLGTLTIPSSDAPATLDLTVAREALLRVSVVDRSARVLSDARVVCVPSPPIPGLPGLPPARVDDLGRHVFHSLGEGAYVLAVGRADHFPERRQLELTNDVENAVEVVLRRRTELVVQVREADGSPARGVSVEVRDAEGGALASTWIANRYITSSTGGLLTGDDGELVLHGVPEGVLVVTAYGQERRVTTTVEAVARAVIVAVP